MGGGNSFGTYTDLTINTDYICPCDGYFRINSNFGVSEYTFGYVEDALLMSVGGIASTAFKPWNSIFVKQGMTIKFTGSSNTDSKGRFFPLA